MTTIHKSLMWFYMLTKRLLRQWSFLLLLCLIPLATFGASLAMQQESGVMHILLCHEARDESAARIIDGLLNDGSIISFTSCGSIQEAEQLVAAQYADAAWIFPADFSERMDAFVSESISPEPFIRIVQAEDSMTLRIAQQKLFGAMAREFSFSNYKTFAYSNIVKEETVSLETLESYYDGRKLRGDIVRIRRLDSEVEVDVGNMNYLTAPIRGLLSLLVVLCTLAAAMYFLKEQSEGKFSWLPVNKRIIPALASCFSAALLSGTAVFIALQLVGISVQPAYEACCMLAFVLAATGFCSVFCVVFRSAGKVGALLPGLLIVMLALSPIFFHVKVLKPVRMLLPTVYYLESIYNTRYLLYAAIYCLVTGALSVVLNIMITRQRQPNSLI